MKTILCFGDSNTWGYIPGTLDFETLYFERYAYDIRWPGYLQTLLGEHYRVIEEGLCNRTTNVDYVETNPIMLGTRNGLTYFEPCLFSHAPLDLVIIMLGINDMQAPFNRAAQDIANGMEELIKLVQSTQWGADLQSPPKILLIGNPIIKSEVTFDNLFAGGVEKGKQLLPLYEELAKRYGCEYLDASHAIEYSDIDGFHFDEKAHKQFAELMAQKILNIHL